ATHTPTSAVYALSLHDALPICTPVDLVINFGAKIGRVTRGARLVHVSTDSDSVGRIGEVDLSILAHVSTFIDDLSNAMDGLLTRSEEHTSELQSRSDLVCRLLL